jgi:hypothetical protein
MLDFDFHRWTRVHFGRKALEQLPGELARYGRNVLLVTGGRSVRVSGLYDRVKGELAGAGKKVFEVTGVTPNPRVTSVREGVVICKREKVDLLLAVGGGSTIDAAKGMAMGALSDRDVWDFYTYKASPEAALPLGCVLTLAATGTEMNGNTVVSNWETKEKQGFGSPLLQPRFSILDPGLTTTVPLDQTVFGCVDIMAHVFEQYFSHTPDTPLQDRMAEAILVTMVEESRKIVKDLKDHDTRANILWCGTMALNDVAVGVGKAGDWATHGMEHELSALYDIPHGAGLAILFPQWMTHVLSDGTAKFEQYAVRVWGVDPAGKSGREVALEGIRRTREFFREIGAPTTLREVRIDDTNIPHMARQATRFGAIGNYRKLEARDVEAILRASL